MTEYRYRKIGEIAAGSVMVLDQLSKYFVSHNEKFENRIVKNSGLPFGADMPWGEIGLPGFFNAVIVAAALIVFIYLYYRYLRGKNPAAFGLIIGGALSNLADRIADGYVIDFIDIGIATMNIADVAIWGGIIILLFTTKLRKGYEHTKEDPISYFRRDS